MPQINPRKALGGQPQESADGVLMTDRIEMYRLIQKGRHIRRFFPPEATTPEGWSPFYTDTPIDYSAVKRYTVDNGTSSSHMSY